MIHQIKQIRPNVSIYQGDKRMLNNIGIRVWVYSFVLLYAETRVFRVAIGVNNECYIHKNNVLVPFIILYLLALGANIV